MTHTTQCVKVCHLLWTIQQVGSTSITEEAVKKLCLLAALAFSSVALVPQSASAQTKPVQLGLVTPLQIVPEDQSVDAFRLCLIYCANEDVKYVDIGLVLKTRGEQSFVQLGAVGLGNDFTGVQWNWAGAYNTGYLSACRITGHPEEDMRYMLGRAVQIPIPGEFYRSMLLKPAMKVLTPV